MWLLVEAVRKRYWLMPTDYVPDERVALLGVRG